MTAAPAHVPALEADKVTRFFGGVAGARDVTLTVDTGQVVGLIGPNGAGKSTVLNCLSGADKPSTGQVRLNGVDVTNWSDHRRARQGIGRTFQLLRLFPTLNVSENIALALEGSFMTHAAGGGRPATGHLSRKDVTDRTEDALDRVGMSALRYAEVSTLTAGQKRLAEIARLLAMNLQVLLLDEPAAGLNLGEADQLFDLIAATAASGKAVLLVEHRIRAVVRIADHMVVMDHGVVIAEGAPTDVMSQQAVQDAYMGPKADAHR
ncbi:MAG: hypothetical protein NVSMB13_07900 [Mycobacteriales bacterium]